MRNNIVLPVLLAASLALTAITATADDLRGLYAGIGLGSTSVEDVGDFDDSDTSFKIFAGYSFNKYLAVELSYLDGGTAQQSQGVLFFDTPSTNAFFRTEIDNKLVNLSLAGSLPLTESFSLFGKLGYAHIDTDTKFSFFSSNPALSGLAGTDNNQRNELSYGAGASYSFGKSFQLRAEYEGFDVSRGDLSSLTLSGVFRF